MYRMQKWTNFDYSLVAGYTSSVIGRGEHRHSVSDLIIMADTETSKEEEGKVCENYLVAWTLSIVRNNKKLVTYYGSTPESFVNMLQLLRQTIKSDNILVFFHNLSYDWVFLRQFLFDKFGYPVKQLNTKPHYPIRIEFENGITLRDSLIIAQRSIDKWSKDLDVPDKKAVDHWDYNKKRNQGGDFTKDELLYIEHDTLAGAECLASYCKTLGKSIGKLPFTATGIVRERFREVARKNNGHKWFKSMSLDYQYVALSEAVYHGGFTHMNRFLKGVTIDLLYTDGVNVECQDLASSYPWALISEKYPAEKFTPIETTIDHILETKDSNAYMFTATFIGIKLKDPKFPMPPLQESKAQETYNEITDNGRILQADAVVIPLNEIDLYLIDKYYTYDKKLSNVSGCIAAMKQYLPRWFTDFVYNLFIDKTKLKGGDKVLYALKKAMLNSCYGMCCQHVMKDLLEELYETGEYQKSYSRSEEDYDKYLKSRNTFLPYQIGIWCTSYAMKNLFELGECVGKDGEWIYTDTDSVFGYNWDHEKLDSYNLKRRKLLKARGYDGVTHNGRVYWIGNAELDKVCTEFRGLHSKCYSYRDEENELHITVAGVPKSGVKCLNNDINNFNTGFVFEGTNTGKLQHTYFFNKIHTDDNGNRIGDSIDLSPCDYQITDVNNVNFMELITDDVEIEGVVDE